MKRLFGILAVLLLWSAASAATLTYDNAAADNDASNVANWAPNHNVLPANGDTINLATGVARPTVAIGAAGACAFNFNITNVPTLVFDLAKFITGDDSINNVTLNANAAVMAIDSVDVAGTTTVTAGSLKYLDLTATGTISISSAAWFCVDGTKVAANGGMDLAGMLVLESVLDTTTITASGNFTIYWDLGDGEIEGALDANGHVGTHLFIAPGNSLTCNTTGTLALGQGATSACDALPITIDSAATITLGEELRCGAFTLTSGSIDCASYDVRCYGDLESASGQTVSNTGTWHMQGTGGAYLTWCNWASPIPLSVERTGTITCAANTCYVTSLAGSANMDITTRGFVAFKPANNFWTHTGSWAATTGYIQLQQNVADLTNDAIIDVDEVEFKYRPTTQDHTLTLNGGMTCGALALYHNTATKTGTLAIAGGSLNASGAVTLGAGGDKSGALALCAGLHGIASLAAFDAVNDLNNGLTTTAATRLRCTGTMDAAGVAVIGNSGMVTTGIVNNLTAANLTGRIILWGCTTDGTTTAPQAEFAPRTVGGAMPMAR